MKQYKPLSLKAVKTCSLAGRTSRVSVNSFAGAHEKNSSFAAFLARLPDFFAVSDFRSVVAAIVQARQDRRPVVIGMGAHPIKLGLSPIIIDLIRKGIITAVATNGACVVHDFELAMAGHTSEDVARELCSGTFGMAKDTGRGVNLAINRGVKKGNGLGRSAGEYISKGRYPFRDKSIFCQAYELGVPDASPG